VYLQAYENEMTRLQRENGSLKDQLQRSLTELRSYQLKYPPIYSGDDAIKIENLPPWTTSEEIISPLFEAYDARIAEMEKLIETQSIKLEDFHDKVLLSGV
jgi:hypothetical protein